MYICAVLSPIASEECESLEQSCTATAYLLALRLRFFSLHKTLVDWLLTLLIVGLDTSVFTTVQDLIYCLKTHKYVLLFSVKILNYGLALMGQASLPHIGGQFEQFCIRIITAEAVLFT